MLDDAHDEGEETLTLSLSNASSGRLTDSEAIGGDREHGPDAGGVAGVLRAPAAVHVVEHVEERLQAPRQPGFRCRFAGRELRKGMERQLALSFLNQLGSAAGVSPVGESGYGPMGGSASTGFDGRARSECRGRVAACPARPARWARKRRRLVSGPPRWAAPA